MTLVREGAYVGNLASEGMGMQIGLLMLSSAIRANLTIKEQQRAMLVEDLEFPETVADTIMEMNYVVVENRLRTALTTLEANHVSAVTEFARHRPRWFQMMK